MGALKVLEDFLEGRYQAQSCASEEAYYALWHEHGLVDMEPTECAIAGALLADRLPWVFAAGYQATLHNAFLSLPRHGWAAFAATEDTQSPARRPGTTLIEEGGRYLMNGDKSWVAHSKIVDHLIVTVNDPGGDKRRARGLIIERNRAGLSLTHREQPGFLAEMSQGFAHFEQTPVASNEVFEFEQIRQFGRTEAKFVMLACASFMLARTQEASTVFDRLLTSCVAIANLIQERDTSRQAYASIERAFQQCVDAFEKAINTDSIPGYGADSKLFRMYSDRIQRRREYAKQEVSARTGEGHV